MVILHIYPNVNKRLVPYDLCTLGRSFCFAAVSSVTLVMGVDDTVPFATKVSHS